VHSQQKSWVRLFSSLTATVIQDLLTEAGAALKITAVFCILKVKTPQKIFKALSSGLAYSSALVMHNSRILSPQPCLVLALRYTCTILHTPVHQRRLLD